MNGLVRQLGLTSQETLGDTAIEDVLLPCPSLRLGLPVTNKNTCHISFEETQNTSAEGFG